jgi:hypothetical protein
MKPTYHMFFLCVKPILATTANIFHSWEYDDVPNLKNKNKRK